MISSEHPISFSIKITTQAINYEEPKGMSSDDEYDSDEECEEISAKDLRPSIQFQFTIPEKYPDEKPSIELLESCNLEQYEISKLMEMLDKETEASMGTVMIFNLVSATFEWLSNKQESEQEAPHEEGEEETKNILERQAEENRKIDGTPVTKQSFLIWKAKFDAEMLKISLEKLKKTSEQSSSTITKRLTGRELFESDNSMIESDLNFVEDLDQDQIEALMQDVHGLELDEDDETDLEEQDSDISFSDEELSEEDDEDN